MKKVLLLVASLLTFIMVKAGTSPYEVNDQQIEALFAKAVDVSLSQVMNTSQASEMTTADLGITGAAMASSDKNPLVAVLLNFFLGTLGIHRFYLGTKPLTGIGYILSCGGIFGIVPLVDFIVLLVNYNDISPYVDNPKFFMWSGK